MKVSKATKVAESIKFHQNIDVEDFFKYQDFSANLEPQTTQF